MQEHHIDVRRTARFHTLGDPGAAEVWIVCHGYAQLARFFLRAFSGIDDGSRYIVAPEGLNRYYYETAPGVHSADARIAATWMTREDREREIDDYIAYLDTLAAHVAPARRDGRDERRVIALGFSQGAATVSRWAARGTARIDHVILWASPPAPELTGEALSMRGARLTIAIGTDDGQIPQRQVDQQETRLRNAGVKYDLLEYAGGHRIEPDAVAEIARRLR